MKVSVAVDMLKNSRSQIDSNEAREFIRLLERGEAFEKMWEGVKDIISSHTLLWLKKRMEKLEQENIK